MNFNNLTIKSQEAIQQAQQLTMSQQQQAIETGHILKGIFLADENVVPFILKKLNVHVARLNEVLDAVVTSYPKVSGGTPYLSHDSTAALQKANLFHSFVKIIGNE